MKQNTFALAICILLLSTCFSSLYAQTEQEQRIHSSYILTFGIDGTPAEIAYWKTRGNLSIAQLIAFHKQGFTQNVNMHKQSITRAFGDALGRFPSTEELNAWMTTTDTYTDIVKQNVNYLIRNNDAQTTMIKQAYKVVLNRKPTDNELGWAIVSGGLSYSFWLAYLRDPRRNGNTFNTANSPSLITYSVSPVVAAEARSAAGLVASGGGNLVASGGGNLVASGGGNLVASGGGN